MAELLLRHKQPSQSAVDQHAKRCGRLALGLGLCKARRRTMAVCRLSAFIVLTIWPCMPPGLLNDPPNTDPDAQLVQGYGFVDTIHDEKGQVAFGRKTFSAINTVGPNRLANLLRGRLAEVAMLILHFGYSLMIGLTLMRIRLTAQDR